MGEASMLFLGDTILLQTFRSSGSKSFLFFDDALRILGVGIVLYSVSIGDGRHKICSFLDYDLLCFSVTFSVDCKHLLLYEA